ncbi:MAG: site-specific integrase, partial [Candidatus Levybacteria bacterium]|nr:site-specific integrase [Candidatus Levybacteria bacterium]
MKNYKADVGQFIAWFEKEFKLPFDPLKITLQIFEKYKQARSLSESSMLRHTSSLRKFFSFLMLEEIIFKNPLEKLTVSAEALTKADPWMIRNFKNFLYEYKKSNLTIKNYINDLRGFFAWFEEVALAKHIWNVADRNLLSKINFTIIQEYKQRLTAAKFSPLTINRKLSSLRNYIGWAKSQGLIPSSHPEFISGSQYKEMLKPAQHDTIMVQDDKADYSPFPPTRLIQKSAKGINSLFDNLFIVPLAQTLEQTRYLFWKVTGKKIFKKNIVPPIQSDEISNIKKEFYAPLSISIRYLSTPKRIWYYIHHARPNWYKKYHSYSFTHYFHFAILMILSCAVGFGTYNGLFADTQKGSAILGASTSAPPRILSFQGKLTDTTDSPISEKTVILFSLYDDENASAGAALWQEDNAIKPDSDGIFSVFLGKKTPIPDTTFSQNSKLFLGITVGNSPELRPRQELATVPYASNAETLQGLEPITNTTKVSNVVLALDSSGNLSIAGSRAHTFQVIGGNLVLSGKVLSLTTVPGSNSNIEIVPNGMGKIDLSKPIQNSTNNNNLLSAIGSVEFDDTVAILATTSSQAALYINQNSTGVLISASTSGTAKFVVENDGTGRFTGDLAVNGGDLISSATSFNLLNSTVTTLSIGGAATTLNIGVSGGTTFVKSNLTVDEDFTLPSLTSNGGILYTNASGKILQVSAGSSSDCLMGGTTPSFSACSVTNIFNQASGAIYPSSITSDLLLGAT